MKRFFAFLLLAVVFSSCDDGDLTEVSFEFDDAAAYSCSNITDDNFFIYKTQNNRALIVQIPESYFENKVTADLAAGPTVLTIDGSTIRLIYREYSGSVSSTTFCSIVPPSEPSVTEEIEASEGTISITTTAITSEVSSTGVTQITSFRHTLTFTDLKFELGDGNNQINESISQITYDTAATAFQSFAGLTGLLSCDNDDSFLFKYNSTQALVLDLSDADAAYLFSSDAGPKTRLISDENKLTHLFFDTEFFFLNDDYFCITPTPLTPVIIDIFTAKNGVENVSGIIEVTSLASDDGYEHTIVLKSVRLVKGSLKKEMGDEFILGVYETITP